MTDPLSSGFNTENIKNLINNDKGPEYVEAEIIEDGDQLESDVQSYLKSHTFEGLPPSAANSFKELQEKIKSNSIESRKIIAVVEKLFDSLNEKYGLQVKVDLNSVANSLSAIFAPNDMRAMELMISEAYSRTRVILYQQYLSACIQLSSQIFDPSYLMSESLSFDDKLATLERLFGLLEQVETVYEKVRVDDSDMKLSKIKESNQNQISLDNPQVHEFLESLRNSIIKDKEN